MSCIEQYTTKEQSPNTQALGTSWLTQTVNSNMFEQYPVFIIYLCKSQQKRKIKQICLEIRTRVTQGDRVIMNCLDMDFTDKSNLFEVVDSHLCSRQFPVSQCLCRSCNKIQLCLMIIPSTIYHLSDVIMNLDLSLVC